MLPYYVPAGYRRVRVLKTLQYANEHFDRGAILVLDDDSAAKLVKEKRAEIMADPPEAMIATSCPRCGSAMEYPVAVEPSARWQCGNVKCNFGWHR
jgi:hypothetical protein